MCQVVDKCGMIDVPAKSCTEATLHVGLFVAHYMCWNMSTTHRSCYANRRDVHACQQTARCKTGLTITSTVLLFNSRFHSLVWLVLGSVAMTLPRLQTKTRALTVSSTLVRPCLCPLNCTESITSARALSNLKASDHGTVGELMDHRSGYTAHVGLC
jgi:hypothetical protein